MCEASFDVADDLFLLLFFYLRIQGEIINDTDRLQHSIVGYWRWMAGRGVAAFLPRVKVLVDALPSGTPVCIGTVSAVPLRMTSRIKLACLVQKDPFLDE